MPSVERSQSLRNEPRPDSRNSLRPKVSFNRAVHIKRISRKDRLPEVSETSHHPDGGHIMATNGSISSHSKFSTLPTRTPRNGIKRAEKLNETVVRPSERLTRMMVRQEPKPEDSPSSESQKTQQSSGSRGGGQKKKTLGERVRGMFGRKKKEGTEEDELRSRYTEFRAVPRNSHSEDLTDNGSTETEMYSGKRRGSAPETKSSWFRSIERQKKVEHGEDSTRRKLRYFGESDRESSRRKLVESSTESATEGEPSAPLGHRTPSLVYLHTAAVGDIPQRRAETPTKRLSRSVSVLAPWAPRLRPPRSVRTRATQTDLIILEEEEMPPPVSHSQNHLPRPHNLPKLVFTGPSIDESGRRSAAASIPRYSSVHLRGRK